MATTMLKNKTENALDEMKSTDTIKSVENKVGDAAHAVGDKLGEMSKQASETYDMAVDGAKKGLQNAENALNNAGEGIKRGYDNVKDAVSDGLDKARTVADAKKEELKDFGDRLDARSGWEKLKDRAHEAYDEAKEFLEKKL